MRILPSMIAWNVYLHGRHLDTVYFLPECDREYVRRSLIDHDGYDARVRVYRRT